MTGRYLGIVFFVLIVWFVVGIWRLRRRQVTIGPAAGALMAEILDDQRRAAIEIVLEERAAERDPEDREGDLPALENPR